MKAIVKGTKGTYRITSGLIPSPPGVVDIDTNVYVIARDVETDEIVKKQKFVLPQGYENRALRDISEMYKSQAANDFRD